MRTHALTAATQAIATSRHNSSFMFTHLAQHTYLVPMYVRTRTLDAEKIIINVSKPHLLFLACSKQCDLYLNQFNGVHAVYIYMYREVKTILCSMSLVDSHY